MRWSVRTRGGRLCITCGVGICQRTAGACVDGGVGACTPGLATAELCNNALDDDCDGVINNGCNCIYVAPTGVDTAAGSSAAPVLRINTGINKAIDAGINVVCVASGANCP